MHLFYRKSDNMAAILGNFEVFLARFDSEIHHKTGHVKCIRCEGSGRIYDPKDPRDPIEGNKMRNVISCQICAGSGIGKLSDWKKYWRADKKFFTAKWKQEAADKARRKQILKKLTKSDIDFLGLGRYKS
jgi:hypothetical protein